MRQLILAMGMLAAALAGLACSDQPTEALIQSDSLGRVRKSVAHSGTDSRADLQAGDAHIGLPSCPPAARSCTLRP